MTKKDLIDLNIRDNTYSITINDIEFDWKFSMASLFDLIADCAYENEAEIMTRFYNGDLKTVIEIFYAGIIWEDYKSKPSFYKFSLFINQSNIDEIVEFLIDALEKSLYPKKKD